MAMAFEYPDVMNDVLEAGERFESGAVQYLATAPEQPVPAGWVFETSLVLQSIMEVPVKVDIGVKLPRISRKLGRLPQPLFEVYRSDIHMTLTPGEVGELILPMQVRAHVPPGDYEFAVEVQSETEGEGRRVRSQQMERRVGEIKIRHPQGMRIAQIASWGYEAKRAVRQVVGFSVSESTEATSEAVLKPSFRSLWTPEDWDVFAEARQEANDRRVYAVPQLTPESLYLRFMEQAQSLFSSSAITLHVGEAIFVAKMLTHTVTYMLGQQEWQDCLLVPIYAYANLTDQPTDDAVWLVTELGFTHVIELAVALSFALSEELLERQIWSPREQRAVREFVADSLGEGKPLPTEFLYLPVVLGGLAAADRVQFEGEDVGESLRLLRKAKDERAELFSDEDLRELDYAFERTFARQARRYI
jgi:hypothetical protein